jgi:hypothetical protein
LENLSSTREHAGQAKENIERIAQPAATVKTDNRLALIAHPGSVASRHTESQRQKLCKILIDSGSILVGIESVEANNDAIQSPVLFLQYLELHGWYGGLPRSIWRNQNEGNYRRKQLPFLELKQHASAWVFTEIVEQNLEYLTHLKRTMQELNECLQQAGAAADDIAWAYRRHANLGPDFVLRYPRFRRTGFLPLLVQQSDSGL